MSGRATDVPDGEPYRFFTQSQVDHILREGSKQGRAGSHVAITKILEHEPNLERSTLWKRIRQLKRPPHGATRHKIVWDAEDDRALQDGYSLGGPQKREAIRQVLARHPDWEPSAVWKHARKLGLTERQFNDMQPRHRHRWAPEEDVKLLGLAGEMDLKMISEKLGRSERAVACRVAWWGKRSRVHNDGYARKSLARELHMGWMTIQRLIIDGFLEVRDPRITKDSIAKLHKSGDPLDRIAHGTAGSVGPTSSTMQHCCRSKRTWAAVAAKLNVSLTTVETLIMEGVLKLCDPRVTETSLQDFCHRYGAAISRDFLPQDTRAWLRTCMDFDPNSGRDVARRFMAYREHAMTVRRCAKCGRAIRGNVFFRHFKDCQGEEHPGRKLISTAEWINS